VRGNVLQHGLAYDFSVLLLLNLKGLEGSRGASHGQRALLLLLLLLLLAKGGASKSPSSRGRRKPARRPKGVLLRRPKSILCWCTKASGLWLHRIKATTHTHPRCRLTKCWGGIAESSPKPLLLLWLRAKGLLLWRTKSTPHSRCCSNAKSWSSWLRAPATGCGRRG
jgi:hypothetical protein